MGEKIKETLESNPLIDTPTCTYMHINAHAAAYLHTKHTTPHPLVSSPSPKRYQKHLNGDFDEGNGVLNAALSIKSLDEALS